MMRRLVILGAIALAGCQDKRPGGIEDPPVVAGKSRPAANSVAGQTVPPPSTRTSAYTALDEANCSLVEENRDEGPYWRRRCPGPAGYAVEWTESDLRQGLEIISGDGRRADLELSAIVANGAFNRLGPRIEWRGNDPADPEAIIVRMFVADASDPVKPDRSLLAIARLGRTTCIVAVVPPGAGQNDQARSIADGRPRPCIGKA